jgi:hypothetical protein
MSMLTKNLHVRFDAVNYGALSALTPTEDLPTDAVARRDRAVAALEETPEDAVLAVAPESLATGYRLAQEPLTAVRLCALPAATARTVADRVGRDVDAYDLLVWGRPGARENHSLRKYA